MPSIVIIGAGRGVGAAVARRFGREGFGVGLVARDAAKLQALASDLIAEGIDARGFTADVLDPASVTAAVADAEAAFGTVDVLQYSPIPAKHYLKSVLDSTADELHEAFRFSVLGSHAAVSAVLPGMRERGAGTILLINGGTSVTPRAGFAGTSIGFAGESAYGLMLHETLAPEGIHVVQLVIPGAIDADSDDRSPAVIADRIWLHHETPTEFRDFLIPMDQGREPGDA
jgi:NADP-dependent 3-hydroxy acid dehydrogenase YdfG